MEFENKGEISGKTIQNYKDAKYMVKTIKPDKEHPYYKNYLLSWEELSMFIDGTSFHLEYIVSVDALL
jgi:hypothetical protein